MAELDRVITVGIEAEGHREDGIYIPGPVTNYRVWARRESVVESDVESPAGTRIKALVRWRIRWFDAISRADVDRVSVMAEDRTWNVEALSDD